MITRQALFCAAVVLGLLLVGALVADAQQPFTHGQCPVGSHAFYQGQVGPGASFDTCVRYADTLPPFFSCQYGWQLQYDAARITPTLVRPENVTGWPGADWVAQSGTNLPPPGCPGCTSSLLLFIYDTDISDDNWPLRDPNFTDDVAELRVTWTASPWEFSVDDLSGVAGQGGVGLVVSSGMCSFVADVNNNAADAFFVGTLLDSDQDGVVDIQDNCSLVANTTQNDTDQDGYGNACDPTVVVPHPENIVTIGDVNAHVQNYLQPTECGGGTTPDSYDHTEPPDCYIDIGDVNLTVLKYLNTMGVITGKTPELASGLECADATLSTAPCN